MTNLVQPFSVGYPRTLELNAQTPSSDNSVMRTVQKVFIAAETALMAVAETFLNLAKIVANLGISLVNRVHSLFIKKEELETEQQVQQVTLMQKAKNLGSRVLNGTKGLLSSSASKVASGATASVQFAKDHKKAIGATVALAGLGAAGYYGYRAYTSTPEVSPRGETNSIFRSFQEMNTAKTAIDPNTCLMTEIPRLDLPKIVEPPRTHVNLSDPMGYEQIKQAALPARPFGERLSDVFHSVTSYVGSFFSKSTAPAANHTSSTNASSIFAMNRTNSSAPVKPQMDYSQDYLLKIKDFSSEQATGSLQSLIRKSVFQPVISNLSSNH